MQDDRQMTLLVCETYFLSSFLQIERLELIKDLFKEENLYIPVAVHAEIAKTNIITDLLDKEWVRI